MNRLYNLSFICLIFILVSCSNDFTNQKLISKIDSLSTRIAQLEDNQKISDTVITKDTVIPEIKKTETVSQPKEVEIQKQITQPEKKIILPQKKVIEPTPNEIVKTVTDTIYYYYKNSKKISVKITPWVDEKRKILLNDLFGKETYSIEDVRHSYSSVSEIKSFHSNGAVDRIETHLNPGASMYWYESSTTFETNNQPLWQTNQKFPASLDDYTNNASYWDKKCNCWKKQEVSIDQPPMRD